VAPQRNTRASVGQRHGRVSSPASCGQDSRSPRARG